MKQKAKTDLRYEFEEILIPTLQTMVNNEEAHLERIRALNIPGYEAPIDRCIDSCIDSIRYLKKRIQEYKKYVSELKD